MGELKTLFQAAEIDIETKTQAASGLPLAVMVAQHNSPTATQSPVLPSPVSTVSSPLSSQHNSPYVSPGFNPIASSSSPTLYILILVIPYGFNCFILLIHYV